MARKATNGAGTSRQRKDGTWEGRITIGKTADGKQKRKSVYGKTNKEVLAKMTKIQNALLNGTNIEPSKLTLESWLIQWLQIRNNDNIRLSTIENYSIYVYKQIIPRIGYKKIKDIKPMDLQWLYSELLNSGRRNVRTGKQSSSGLSPTTVRLVHIILRCALECAVKNDMIAKNPAKSVSPPTREKFDIMIFTEQQRERFVEVIKNTRFEIAYLLAIHHGMRMGEILGLRWQDIDFENRCIRIKQQLMVKPKEGLAFGPPKTQSAYREIYIFGETIKALRKHKVKQCKQRMPVAGHWEENDLVVCNQIGKPIFPSNLRRDYKRILEMNDLPNLRFHDLRHNFASYWASKKANYVTLGKIMGHSKTSFTLDTYTHATSEMVRKDAEFINDELHKTNDTHDDDVNTNTPF